MEAYEHKGRRNARARDFYDIYAVVKARQIDFGSDGSRELVRHIFAAKLVPLSFLKNLSAEREFHRVDWPAVVNSTEGSLELFDYYFDFVLRQVELLKPLWVE